MNLVGIRKRLFQQEFANFVILILLKKKFIFYVIVLLTINKGNSFFKYIVDSAPSFRILDESAKLIWPMTCEDDIVINALADFVYKFFEMRKCVQ